MNCLPSFFNMKKLLFVFIPIILHSSMIANEPDMRLTAKFKKGNVFIMEIEESILEVKKYKSSAPVLIEFDSTELDEDGFEIEFEDESSISDLLGLSNNEPVVNKSKVRIEVIETGNFMTTVSFRYIESNTSNFVSDFLQLPGFMISDFDAMKAQLLKEMYIELVLDKEGRFIKVLNFEETKNRIIDNYSEVLADVMDKVYGSLLSSFNEAEEKQVVKKKKNKKAFELWLKLNSEEQFLLQPNLTEDESSMFLQPGEFKAYFKEIMHNALAGIITSEESLLTDFFYHAVVPFRVNGLDMNNQEPAKLAPAFKSFKKLNFSVPETLNLTHQNSMVILEGENTLSEPFKQAWVNEMITNQSSSITQLLITNQLNNKISEEELARSFLSRFDAKSEVKYSFALNEGFLNSFEQNFEYTNINKFTGSIKINIRKEKP
jgi:hypothetical protein